VFAGDTLWAESEVLEVRESESDAHVGIVSIRTRGINQHGETAVEFRRTLMAFKRASPQARRVCPEPQHDWAV
jgi:acyl dehydratase